ncbi:AAA domain-containing protein [Deinococcus cellulosilyticus]|uniref:Protein kinase domain-containing protein n=1 Tax=Deinococcus cellulosilyticus (strain DSM 18568 / NBRC 106333 / KACC 11606 / 5516J-15) TaxID=1223518 RepID=A0A511NBI5_DEIC1|nr:AAA domain-containing protein [Deinococcus cellulosilyticus]GEM50162.1 hypothetical protein DC3_57970 [Deinococcus cellulosilyticus NBRC 106333 = KACC 11606]
MSSTPDSPPIGEIYGNRYQTTHLINSGKYSVVLKATDTLTENAYAIKLLPLHGPDEGLVRIMFNKERSALENFRHPAVVELQEAFLYHDDHFQTETACLVLELCGDGSTLEQHIEDAKARPHRRRPLEWRVKQLLQLLDGIREVHNLRILHRDIKLKNILMDHHRGTLKLSDFGVARLTQQFGTRQMMTLRGQDHFSLPHAAPEVRNYQAQGEGTDWYSFALVAAELLTYQVAREDFTPDDFSAFLEPLSQEVGDAGFAGLYQVLYHMLSQPLNARPEAGELEDALKGLLDANLMRQDTHVFFSSRIISRIAANLNLSLPEFLAKLNDGLRVDIAFQDDQRQMQVDLYGREVHARANQAGDNLEVIRCDLMGDPKKLQKRREAFPVAYRIVHHATRDAADFLNEVFDLLQDKKVRLTAENRRKAYLELSERLLDLQQQRNGQLWVDLLPIQVTGGRGAIEQITPEMHLDGSNHVTFQITAATNIEPQDLKLGFEPMENLGSTLKVWTELLGGDIDIELKKAKGKQMFGTIVGISEEDQTFTVRIVGNHKLKTEEPITCFAFNRLVMRAIERQKMAIQAFISGQTANPRLPQLILDPNTNRCFPERQLSLIQQHLLPRNEVEHLVKSTLGARDFYLIQGPPGAGKTTTIKEVVGQILDREPAARILITSQNNDAVNKAVRELQDLASDPNRPRAWRFLREVSRSRAAENDLSFEATFEVWSQTTLQNSQAVLPELETLVDSTTVNLSGLQETLKYWHEELHVAPTLKQDYLANIQIFGVTCLLLPVLFHKYSHLQDMHFDWVIVDESARAHHSELLVALVKGERFVLVGDQKQLPPHIEQEDRDKLLEHYTEQQVKTSMFQQLFDQLPASNRTRLSMQFRMHPSIAEFVSKLYYEQDGLMLSSGANTSAGRVPIAALNRDSRVFWFDVKGAEQTGKDGKSKLNHQEIHKLSSLLVRLNQACETTGEVLDVAIITPYAAQKEHLLQRIAPNRPQAWKHLRIKIDTVDAFQGDQADIVFISTVITAGRGAQRWVGDPQRLNVAFSRAKRAVFIFGDLDRAAQDPELKRAIELIPQANRIPGATA